MSDSLAPYRRSGSAPQPAQPAAPAGAKVAYEAFATKDRVRAIDIMCKDGSGHSATYNYLLYAAWDRLDYTSFFIVFSFMMVKVTGRNLHDVVQAVRMRKCEFICEFSATEHESPAPDAPCIESVEVKKSPAAEEFMAGDPTGRTG